MIRLLPDGRPDPAFSGDGVALVDHGYGNDSAEAVVLRGGKVIVAGDGRRASGSSRFGIARLRGDGRLDRSFGRRGHRLVSFGARRLAGAYGLAAAPRGRFAVAGSAVVEGRQPQMALARLAPRRRRARPHPHLTRPVRRLREGRARHARRDRSWPGARSTASPAPARRTGRSPATRPPAGCSASTAPTSAPARTQAEAIALTPGHATVAGSIYGSHGVARYLTR